MFLSVEQTGYEADDQGNYNVVVGVEQREEEQPKGEDEDEEAESAESAFYFLEFLEDNHGVLL